MSGCKHNWGICGCGKCILRRDNLKKKQITVATTRFENLTNNYSRLCADMAERKTLTVTLEIEIGRYTPGEELSAEPSVDIKHGIIEVLVLGARVERARIKNSSITDGEMKEMGE